VIWNPMIAIGTYFALGAVVLVSRLVFPKPKATAAAAEAPEPVHEEEQQLRKAA
jgi:hypothetical protein